MDEREKRDEEEEGEWSVHGRKGERKKRRSEEKAIIVQIRAVATANIIILCINLKPQHLSPSFPLSPSLFSRLSLLLL